MRGYVYSIRSHLNPQLVYYGSTKERLSRRLAQHVKGYKSYLNGKQDFITSFKLIELGKFYIELVEIVEYIDKKQLHAVEGRYIRDNVCVNRCQAGRSDAQYRLDNDVAIKAYKAQYRLDNVEAIKAHRAQYQKENAAAINARHAQYDKANAAAIKVG